MQAGDHVQLVPWPPSGACSGKPVLADVSPGGVEGTAGFGVTHPAHRRCRRS